MCEQPYNNGKYDYRCAVHRGYVVVQYITRADVKKSSPAKVAPTNKKHKKRTLLKLPKLVGPKTSATGGTERGKVGEEKARCCDERNGVPFASELLGGFFYPDVMVAVMCLCLVVDFLLRRDCTCVAQRGGTGMSSRIE
jgi:hypothetical protein